jgi:hypothetical protein
VLLPASGKADTLAGRSTELRPDVTRLSETSGVRSIRCCRCPRRPDASHGACSRTAFVEHGSRMASQRSVRRVIRLHLTRHAEHRRSSKTCLFVQGLRRHWKCSCRQIPLVKSSHPEYKADVRVGVKSATSGRSQLRGERRFKTGCGRSDWAGEYRRAPIPDVGQFLRRPSAAPRNLTFGGGGARRRVSDSTTRTGQRLLPLAATGRCRP